MVSLRRAACVVVLAMWSLAGGGPAEAAVIYSCRAPSTPSSILIISDLDEVSSFAELPGTPQEREFESRAGDTITFGGTERFVTSFSTRLAAFGGSNRGYTIDVELSIYANSGGLPGALLWSGVNAGVVIPQSPSLVGVDTVFTPNITLPDSICFAIGFTSITRAAGESRTMGIATFSTPTVGSSPVTTLHQLSADSSWMTQDNSMLGGGIFRHVEARVEAVPAPAALGLLALLLRPVRERPNRYRS